MRRSELDMGPAVGVVGVGRIGSRMARSLVSAGFDVCVFDRDADAAARVNTQISCTSCGTLEDLLGRVGTVVLSLPAPEAVVAVARQIAGIWPKRGLVIDTSTCGVATSRQVAAELAAAGIRFADAPVTGGLRRAASGALNIAVAADRETFSQSEPVLNALASHVYRVGDSPGLGQAAKLVNNILSLGALAATSEAVLVGKAAGLDVRALLELLNASSGRNSATAEKFPESVLTGSFDFGFPVSAALKDVRLFRELAESLNVPILVCEAVVTAWRLAVISGFADDDYTSIYAFLERLPRGARPDPL